MLTTECIGGGPEGNFRDRSSIYTKSEPMDAAKVFPLLCKRGLVAVLFVGVVGCAPSRQTSAPPSSSRCAKSAVSAYRAGNFACAEHLLQYVSNAATRAELMAYMLLKTGQIRAGISEIDRAIGILESPDSRVARRPRRAIRHLKSVRHRFVRVLERMEEDSTARPPDSMFTEQDPRSPNHNNR